MIFPTEILTGDDHPDVPVRTLDVTVDVLSDGSMWVGVADKPADGALFQFIYQPVLVACADDFVPVERSTPSSAYLEHRPLIWLKELEWQGRTYKAEFHDYDDAEIYMVTIGERITGADGMTSHIVAKLHHLDFMLKREREARGYVPGLVKQAG